jgi:AraC-like DNA-binding protein
VDVLSDVLSAVRLTGAVYFDINARAPWVAETPPMTRIGPNVMPGFERVISFHVMLEGTCWAQLSDRSEPPVLLESGSGVLFVRGDPHSMSSQQGQGTEPDLSMYYKPKDKTLPFVFNEFGGDGEPAHFVCGYLGCDERPFNPILDALPRILRVVSTPGSGNLIGDLIRVALQEKERPRAGGESLLAKLSELMFVQAVRQHIETLPPEATGWLAGLRDPQIGTALQHMHGRPAAPWTLETLAHEVGLSRSVFADRFTNVMGVPAMHYLGNWRLQRAAHLLERQSVSVAEAAASVGYESEAAFNRAFKRQVGMPPGGWRKARAAGIRGAPAS